MSIQSPVGTLDIKNATLRVGKLEVSNIQGVDTALNVTRANSVLIYDDQASTTTFTGFTSSVDVRDTGNGYIDLAQGYVYWGQKLPNAWVMDFEMDIRSGTSAGPLYANVFNTTNTGGDGYSFTFNDSNDKITLRYDGTALTETTVPGLFTPTENWQKVVINYERGMIAISVGGTRKFYYKDIERATPYVNGEYVNFSSASADGRKIRNLRVVNGEKWVYTGESNIVYTQGNVGIGLVDPEATLHVGGVVKATSFEGDGSQLGGISSTLQQITDNGNTTSNTIQFTNEDVGLVATGNIQANYFIGDGSQLDGISSTLQQITDNGNTTSNTIQFTNEDVGLVATGNIQANYFIGDGSQLDGISSTLQQITDNGNTTSNTIQFTNEDVGLVATGNIQANYFIGDGSQLDGISSTLQQITDNGNTTSNTIQFTNEDVGLVATGNIQANYFIGDGTLLSNVVNDTDLQSNVTILRGEIDSNLATARADLQSNVTILRGEIDSNLATARADLQSNVTILRGEIDSNLATARADLQSNVTILKDTAITFTGIKTFEDDVILESNLRIQGDLLVANTVNMTVSDPILELGSNNQNTGDVGLVMTRHGTSNSNVAVFFDESTDILKLGYTLDGANDSTLELDSNSLAVSVQGAFTAASLSGDGSGLTNIQSSNVSDFASNVTRIGTLETDLTSNASRVGTLETDLTSNASRVGTLETDLTSNASRVGTLETDLTSNASRVGTLETDLTSNASRVGTLETDLTSNASRVGTLETDLTSNASRVETLETDLTSNASRVETLETDLTSNASRVETLETDLTSNVTRITNLESSDMTIGGEKTFSSNFEVGTANLFVDTTTGNVGIGTTSPGAKLHVDGAIYLNSEDLGLISPDSISDAANRTKTYIGFGHGGTANDWAYLRQIGASNGNHLALDFHDDGGDAGFSIRDVKSTDNPDTVTTRFMVERGGNVGIGTDDPAYKLDVHGTSNVGALTATSVTVPNDGDFVMNNKPLTPATGLHWDTANSRLGVGTASPAYTLHVNGTSQFEAEMRWDLGTHVSHAGYSTNSDWYIRSGEAAGKVILQDTGGNVGIGLTNPSKMLHVKGEVVVGTSADNYQTQLGSLYFIRGAGRNTTGLSDRHHYISTRTDGVAGGGSGNNMIFHIDDSSTTDGTSHVTPLTLRGDGRVGIGTTSPEYTLDVHGTSNVGALTATSVSGDGAGLSNIQTSNVIGLTDNVTRIGTLETDLTSNATRIGTLETDLTSNASRVGTLETDLTSNASRVGTLETDLTSNASRVGTLETDLTSNASRVGTLETDLTDNVTRIGTLETDLTSNVTRIGNLESSTITISGEKTFTSLLKASGGIQTYKDGVVAEFEPATSGEYTLINFHSKVNSGSDKGFILVQDESANSPGTGTEDLRMTIGVHNDFRQSAGHSDELWFQGGGRLCYNVGSWDSELDTIIGTPGVGTTGGHEWRVNNSAKMVINHAGDVGIGTDSPSAPLHIYKASNYPEVYVDYGTSGQKMSMHTGTAGSVIGYSGYLTIGTITGSQGSGLSQKMRITSDGKVGIGVTSPDNKLEVRGNIQASLSDTNHGMIVDSGGTVRRDYGGAGAGFHFTNNAIWPTNYAGTYSAGGMDFGSSSYRWNNVYTEALNASGQVYSSGAFYTDANRSVIRGGSPTLYFRDTDQMSAMIHNNSNLLYILGGGTDTETWSQVNGQWPWIFNLSNNDSTCGGNLYIKGTDLTLSNAWSPGVYYRIMGYNNGKQIQFSYNDGTWISDNNSIRFGVGGTQGTSGLYSERMRITSGGNVGIGTTAPDAKLHVNGYIKNNNPVFHAYRDSAWTTANYATVPFNVQVHDSTNSYNTNGTFTAPVAGYYFFSVFALTNGNISLHFEFHKNGALTNGAEPFSNALGSNACVSGSIVIYLNVNDYVEVVMVSGQMYGGGNHHNGFCGYLIG